MCGVIEVFLLGRGVDMGGCFTRHEGVLLRVVFVGVYLPLFYLVKLPNMFFVKYNFTFFQHSTWLSEKKMNIAFWSHPILVGSRPTTLILSFFKRKNINNFLNHEEPRK